MYNKIQINKSLEYLPNKGNQISCNFAFILE